MTQNGFQTHPGTSWCWPVRQADMAPVLETGISIPGTSYREMQKMDKYEFNIKVEQIKKMVNKGDYETAMKIADTIDWRRVRNVNILSMVATIYEKNGEYQEAKDILLLAFERAPIGKRLLFKLAELAIKEGSIREAEDYYREFCDLAPDDPRQYILRYMILGAKGAPVEQLIIPWSSTVALSWMKSGFMSWQNCMRKPAWAICASWPVIRSCSCSVWVNMWKRPWN